MIELVESVSTDPTKLVRKFYIAVPDNQTATDPRTQTNDRFEVGSLKENIKVVDDIEWKMTLYEYTTLKAKWTSDAEA